MRLRVMRVLSRMNVGGPAVQASVLHRGLDPDRFEQRLHVGDLGVGEADHLSMRDRDLPVHRVPGLGRSVRPGDDVRALATLVRQMREFRPHIVHTHAAKAGALGRMAARLTGVAHRVHTYHGHLLHGYFGPLQTRGVIAVERALAKRTDRLIAVGAQVRDDLLSVGIGQSGQYEVVPPGTVLGSLPPRRRAREMLGLPPDAPVVGFVGRLTAIKRPDRLRETISLVRAQLPEAVLLVCGDGPAGLHGDGIRHIGWRSDVESVYAAIDVALLASDNEGMPVSLIEAGLAGVPAVSTAVGSVGEVVRDGVTGLLCPPSPAGLADATVKLLRDPPLRQSMGKAGREWARDRFTASRLVADMDRIYTELAS